jgi:hypothetical protein
MPDRYADLRGYEGIEGNPGIPTFAAVDPANPTRAEIVAGINAAAAAAAGRITKISSPFTNDELSRLDYEAPRASFPVSIAGNVGTYVCTEPLLHGLLSSTDEPGVLTNIRELAINLQFEAANLAYKLWSTSQIGSNNTNSSYPTAAGITITKATAIVRYTQPSIEVPSIFEVPYTNFIVRNQAITGTHDSGATMNVTFSNLILGHIPRRIYVFAKFRDSNLAGLANQVYRTDGSNYFARIDRLNVTFGGRSGLLGGMGSR